MSTLHSKSNLPVLENLELYINRLIANRLLLPVERGARFCDLDRLAVAKKRNERVYFLIGVGLLVLSVLFEYRNYANQKRANVQLAGLNQHISEANRELASKNTQFPHK